MQKRIPALLMMMLVALILTAIIAVATVMASRTGPQESGASQIQRVTGSRNVPEASLFVSDDPMDDPVR